MAKKKTVEAEIVHSPKFDKVQGYFDRSLWNATKVKNAVVKEWITADEFREITGEAYE